MVGLRGVKGLRLVGAVVALAFVGAVGIVMVAKGGGLLREGGGRVFLLQKRSRPSGLWNGDYLWNTPGSDLAQEYEHGGPLVAGAEHSRERDVARHVAQLRQMRMEHTKVARKTQSLCGFGSGCESENTWIVKEAANLNASAVNKVNFSKNRTVSDSAIAEVQKAMDAYDKEMDFEKEFRAGSPYNSFKGKQQALRQMVLPPGEGTTRTHKLCVQGAACEQWADMQINVAEQIDHERVNQNIPPKPSDDTMQEVQHAMEEQKLNPARHAHTVAVPLPPY